MLVLCVVLWGAEWLMPGFSAPVVNLPGFLLVVSLFLFLGMSQAHASPVWLRRVLLMMCFIPLIAWVCIVFGFDSQLGVAASMLLGLACGLFAMFVPEKVS